MLIKIAFATKRWAHDLTHATLRNLMYISSKYNRGISD
jgi:hypothetical protein